LANTVTIEEQQLTSAGTMLGTVAYMSPEQIRAKELDARSDLFSFGAVLYEMAAGSMPFEGASSGEIFGAILHQNPRPASNINPQLPPQVEAIIDKALEKDRNMSPPERPTARGCSCRSDLRYFHIARSELFTLVPNV
jgi:eukaryotic-like serine/threonine-protein kinase